MSSDQPENQQGGFPGHEFVTAREKHNLSLQQVSAELNLPLKALNAIESGTPQSFHNQVFLRGYIRTYAKHLHLDANHYANIYASLPGVDLKPTQIRSTTSVQERDPSRSPFMKLFSWLFVLAIIAVIVWWSREQYGLTPPPPPTSLPEVSEPLTDVFDPPVSPVLPVTSVPSEEFNPGVEGEQDDSVLSESIEIADESVIGDADTVSAVDVSEPDAAVDQTLESSSSQGLYIRFSDDCWIQIRDASDSLIYSGVAQGGTDLQLEGDEPLSLVIGRRDAVEELLFNGELISLSSFTSGNVARFSLPLN
ncbi:hypothetical protein LH51_08995 [Nitrincola sp. A-D6]|uniref:RodZ domain-containing protein n=1 Tax=Nitrincola sp. A-D6 TaxID=1545442 RepID=UPI00051FB3C1|nr:RodZ domain-containing protein [Nitrincola sp. A-D6]KGK42204.1 hypothetical protein LH51_08995 [Nitrincola sp. A-D6]